MTSPVDCNATAPIRAGEELPIQKLEAYLKSNLPNSEGALSVEQFSHGHSNLTYLVRVGALEMVLRRPPFGNQVKSAHDMGREFRVLSKLHTVYPPAPRPYLFCEDLDVLGEMFYLMERRKGIVLRKQLPNGIIFDQRTARALSESVIDNLVLLHSLDVQKTGLDQLGKPQGYVERQVTGWAKRYSQAMTEVNSSMDKVAQWLAENIPSETRASVIHNDYKYDNLLLDPNDLTRIVAVLDWEMATLGDPLMDLGTTLGYWVEANDPEELRIAAFGPTSVEGSLTRTELIERYELKSGQPVSNPVFYYSFGIFKIAVILQQIYARFVRGHTNDSRFAKLDQIVTIMSQQAEAAIRKGEIE